MHRATALEKDAASSAQQLLFGTTLLACTAGRVPPRSGPAVNALSASMMASTSSFANCDADGNEGMTATPASGKQWLFLLNVARQPLDRAISMLCIHPHAVVDAKEMECSLVYSQDGRVINNCHGGDLLTSHYQNSTFRVACTDLSHGLPNPNECFQFVVPNSVVKDHEEYAIQVVAQVTIK
ncbi:hypothetical protein EJB05_33741, partial [Eragrostis curvula]